ncbi:NAD(P)-dependent oxidoreductase [Aestuariimicrobium ganziense]|uniref:NAD(P)-dependent oxidoreductase n=1 Tax=Aestuariimicrobium ganziense TaxID=2773677 RepID=UPI001F2D1A4E|nr:NAD(P)-dependent oxidoreductase [Aestuariimicrobium ganziense]
MGFHIVEVALVTDTAPGPSDLVAQANALAGDRPYSGAMTRVGFVGATGLMGHGMARNIVEKGFELAISLRAPNDRVDDLLAAGTTVVDTAELGRSCDVVVVCVTGADDVAEVVDALLTDPRENLVIVDSSTSEPSMTAALVRRCETKGVRFVDAPLTMGPAEAEAGRLNVIVGATDELLEEVRPVLETFAARIIHAGPTGSAHAIKLINNFMYQTITSAVAEGLGVGAKVGVNLAALYEVITAGGMNCPAVRTMGATINGDYTTMNFQLDNALKDVRYYTRMAGQHRVPTPVGNGTVVALGVASALGFGEKLVPSLTEAAAVLAGVEIRGEVPTSE